MTESAYPRVPGMRVLLLPFDAGASGVRAVPPGWVTSRYSGMNLDAVRAAGGFPLLRDNSGIRISVLRAGVIALPDGTRRAGVLVAVWRNDVNRADTPEKAS